jgi:colanic acid/amylovoran biosynthesis glycosyltransferase
MKVAHLFHAYLKTTENWCYRLIAHLKDVTIIVVTDTILNKEKFPLPLAAFSTPWFTYQIFSNSPILQRGMKFISRIIWVNSALPTDLGQAELLHAHFATMGWLYLPLRRKLRLPLIVSFYGYDYEWLPRNESEWRKRYKILFEEVELFLTEGCAGREKLISMGCPGDKVRVARLGVNPREIPFLLRHKEVNTLHLVQVATFTEKKGHSTTLRAFARAAVLYPGLRLTLVGKDPEDLRAELEKIIADSGITDLVTFIDGIDFAQLHVYLHGFDIFIHPSRHSKEGDSEGGAPIVLLDAQATGMPVLSTVHCDIPDEVIHGVTGILVQEDDDEGLAEAIGKFYKMDEAEYHSFCRNARQHIENNYDVIECAAKLKDIYADVITAHKIFC